MIITFFDGTIETIKSNEVYVSPVYVSTPNWYLNYNYIDNISTGSGSWSNADAIVKYQHTFTNPEEKSPTLTPHYNFEYWQDSETGEIYTAGDSFNYSGPELKDGATKNVNIYAMWQPSLTVNWHNNGEKENQIETFSENISIYSYIAQSQLDTTVFAGWYDDFGNRYSIDAEGILPEITKDANSTVEYNAYAMWQPALIINYYDDSGNLLKKTVSFEDVGIYSYTPNEDNFLGWYDSDGNFISLDEIGTLPALSRSNDTFFELNVYAKYSEDPIIPDIIPENKPPKEESNKESEEETPVNNTVVLEEEEESTTFTPDFISISDSTVPLAATQSMQLPLIGSWSLVDLLCTILAILLNIILFILGLRKNKKEDDEEIEEEQKETNYHHFRRLLALIPSIGSILLFLYTQDLTQPMVLFDIWSLVFILIVLAQLIICILSYRKKEEKEEEE